MPAKNSKCKNRPRDAVGAAIAAAKAMTKEVPEEPATQFFVTVEPPKK